MGKPKQRHLAVKPANKKSSPDYLGSDVEDGWVMVKKQRITILIPPRPLCRKSMMPNPGPDETEDVPVKAVNNKATMPIDPTQTTMSPAVEEQGKVALLAPCGADQFAAKTPPVQHFSALDKLRRLNVTMELKRPCQADTFRSQNKLGVSSISKTTKGPRHLHGPGSFLDGGMFLNSRLRASLLEKKLEKAGGLSRWLSSIGLRQFVRIFQGKSFSEFQLANLSMKKLKDMGADAVGPRRKLIHAIDCICQPYCFGAH